MQFLCEQNYSKKSYYYFHVLYQFVLVTSYTILLYPYHGSCINRGCHCWCELYNNELCMVTWEAGVSLKFSAGGQLVFTGGQNYLTSTSNIRKAFLSMVKPGGQNRSLTRPICLVPPGGIMTFKIKPAVILEVCPLGTYLISVPVFTNRYWWIHQHLMQGWCSEGRVSNFPGCFKLQKPQFSASINNLFG